MYGVVLGDMIGSPYEFLYPRFKSKEFELFDPRVEFTDDTILSLALADVFLQEPLPEGDEALVQAFTDVIRKYGLLYPDATYGGRFIKWLLNPDMGPYNSWGNGSAMRSGAAGWVYDDLESVKHAAALTAMPTHNHPEGIKGAQAAACGIYLARTGASKEEIKAFMESEFGYNLDRTLDEIRPKYNMDESCAGSVPEAIIAFLESTSFEDTIRNAVSLGGDSDTQAAIAGGIAEAYYGVPEKLKQECLERLDAPLRDILVRFEEKYGHKGKEVKE